MICTIPPNFSSFPTPATIPPIPRNLYKKTHFLHHMAQALTQNITKDTFIGDIVEQYPEVVEKLLSYGVHCVGCHVSPYEPLGEGLQSHGMSDEEVSEALSELNAIIEQKGKNGTVQVNKESAKLSITPAAAAKIKEFCQQKNKSALRITVQPGGCSGNSYALFLADEAREDDIVLEQDGARVFIDAASMPKVQGATMDYVDSLMGAGFKFSNPSATKTCGCGNSFR